MMAGRPANTPAVILRNVLIGRTDECWPWQGVRNRQGYGRLQIKGKSYYAHRVVYALFNPGVIEYAAPRDMSISGYLLHNCDNPSCCNPSHLKVGTHQDNMDDKVRHGRLPDLRGEKAPRAKFTMEQVREIRRLHHIEGVGTTELQRRFGLSSAPMYELLKGISYKEEDCLISTSSEAHM